MAKEQSCNTPFDLFADMESDVEDFEGFDARDTREFAEVAVQAPLYHSTPLPKAKRGCIVVDDSSCSWNNKDNSSISLEDDFANGKSSSNSVEGEIAPVIFSGNSCKLLFQTSHISEEVSSSSVGGEVYVEKETKEQTLSSYQDKSTRFGQERTSVGSSVNKYKEDEAPKIRSWQRGYQ